jgi:hypothetical protein
MVENRELRTIVLMMLRATMVRVGLSTQEIGIESHSHFTSHSDRGCQPTHGCGSLSYYVHIKGLTPTGTLDKVHRDLIPFQHLSDRLIRRSSGGKHQTAPSPLPPSQSHRLTQDLGLLPLRRADLLPCPQQVPLRRLR